MRIKTEKVAREAKEKTQEEALKGARRQAEEYEVRALTQHAELERYGCGWGWGWGCACACAWVCGCMSVAVVAGVVVGVGAGVGVGVRVVVDACVGRCECGYGFIQHTATRCTLVLLHLELEHLAAHCSTLQHTPTHSNALQHTPTPCHTLQHPATRSNALKCRCHARHHLSAAAYISRKLKGMCKKICVNNFYFHILYDIYHVLHVNILCIQW